jgi:hypothetical protein
MQTRYKIWTIVAATVAVLATALFVEIRNHAAVASSDITATVRKEAPAPQYSPLVPAYVLDPVDLQWGPRTDGDQN